ncbi:hypothetical protein MJO28_013837 [Puccinia striiformis f. sp. tritici]|uniref:Uncharacterized protein n=1 Tax=Puccinia striiformis f. sp. tritici TaxID=168172 RepID=A0ACC0DW41_9BASI|nr:hypothetical protein MJO28_013837 [Puccinia striiformis f. sp. tritici]
MAQGKVYVGASFNSFSAIALKHRRASTSIHKFYFWYEPSISVTLQIFSSSTLSMVPTLWLIIVLSQASGYILGAPSPGLASTSLASVQKEVPASCQEGFKSEDSITTAPSRSSLFHQDESTERIHTPISDPLQQGNEQLIAHQNQPLTNGNVQGSDRKTEDTIRAILDWEDNGPNCEFIAKK